MQKFLFTARKRSLGQGNIFTGVCLSTGRGVGFPACIACHMTGGSASRGVCLQGRGFASRGDMHPGGSASGVRSAFRGCLPPGAGGLHPEVIYIQEGLHPGGWGRPPLRYMGYFGIQSTSGRYASYWNAFL